MMRFRCLFLPFSTRIRGQTEVALKFGSAAQYCVERHAAAQQVTVRLAFGNDRIDLLVRDDGVGFDPAAVDPDHYGLTRIQERAAMIGAALKVHDRPGSGTRI